MNDSTRYALAIFKATLENERINSSVNEDLYENYKFDSNVSNDVEEIMEMFNIDMYDNPSEGIFISPGVNNKIFGYSNDELKKALSIKNNTELSICFFIMYCILTRFYKESSFIASSEFITREQLIEDVDNKINAVKTMLEGIEEEEVEEESEIVSFFKLVEAWETISHVNIKSKAANVSRDSVSKTKIGFANKSLRFFCDNNLLFHNEVQDIFLVKPKMATIVSYYFDEYKTRSEIVNYLESLSEQNSEGNNSDAIEENNIENVEAKKLSKDEKIKVMV